MAAHSTSVYPPGVVDPRPHHHVRLRKPLKRTLAQGHPWLYRDALEALPGAPGDVVTVLDRRDRFVARGFAEAGPIAVRVLTTRDEPLDRELLGRRLRRAAELRDRVVPPATTAYRLVHGEGDRLPGLVVDIYGHHAVVRIDGQGASAWLELFVDVASEVFAARGVRSILLRTGRRGRNRVVAIRGELPSATVAVEERGMRLLSDLVHGQKTGLFLDHRESRYRVRQLARGLRVLNLYGYTGGFSVAAGLGGASSVTTVDIAPGAIELARETWQANELDRSRHRAHAEDVPAFLARARAERASFDLIVADPPSFAPSESAVAAALASYRALHASALELLAPGGLYLGASCSSHVDAHTFEETLRDGAAEARRVVQVLDRWGAPPDHPRLLGFSEGDYLAVILVRSLG